MLNVNGKIQIHSTEFDWGFSRSSGKGGQNVNKVNSKATLRWSVALSLSITEEVRQRFLARFQSRLTEAGEIVISSDEFRDQPQNVRRCLDKLREMLLLVAEPPKIRRKTKVSRTKKKKRLESKRRHSEKKQSRRNVFDD
jgi:ribosome-associated protein